MLNLHVTNLGIIKQANIDLSKPLIIFSGPNGTGKTYLSYIINALTSDNIISMTPFSDKQIEDFFKEGSFEMPIDYHELFVLAKQRETRVKQRLDVIFGLSDTQVKDIFKGFNLKVFDTEEQFKQYHQNIDYTWSLYGGSLIVMVSKVDTDVLRIENISETANDPADLQRMRTLRQYIINRMVFMPIGDSMFFPVERNSINTFIKDLIRNGKSWMEDTTNIYLEPATSAWNAIDNEISNYPLALRKSLIAASNVTSIAKRKGLYSNLADEIEKVILKGNLSLNEHGDVVFSNNEVKNLPFQISSSMIKTLASLIIYLRHRATPGCLIIIDEPELNLHPDCQILLARVFAKMINAGIRLIISTHSDYIIHELNNLIMLSETTESFQNNMGRLGYSKDMTLSSSKVGAYLFKITDEETKISVDKLQVTNDGFAVKTIDSAINSLNNSSDLIYYNIKFGDEDM